jgi:Uncharacterised nucleotidyltransferase
MTPPLSSLAKPVAIAPCPEMDLLICCARTQVLPETAERMKALIHQGIDWVGLLEQADQHSLGVLLYHCLRDTCSELVPSEILSQLRTDYYYNVLRTMGLSTELLKLLELFEQHHTPVVAFKGPILAAIAYGDIALRSFDDLDLLVQWQDYLKPRSLLLVHGYQPHDHLDEYPAEIDCIKASQDFGEYMMCRDADGICIDIHGRLASINSFFLTADFSCFWDRLQPITLVNQTVLSFCPEDLLLYLCVSGVRDGWISLRSICDVAEVIRSHPLLDWVQVSREAKKLRIERMLFLGLTLANQILDVELPSEVWQWAIADAKAQKLARQVKQQIMGEREGFGTTPSIEKFRFYLAAMQGWDEKLKFCLGLVQRAIRLSVKPNLKDHALLPLPPAFHGLYYFLRPVRLLKDHGIHVFKLIFPV